MGDIGIPLRRVEITPIPDEEPAEVPVPDREVVPA